MEQSEYKRVLFAESVTVQVSCLLRA